MTADAAVSEAYTVDAAYAYCQAMANGHYENFPVASRLLPAALRRPVAVIYAFARSADDLADEGTWSEEQRIALLDAYDRQITAAAKGEASSNPIFVALADVLLRHSIPPQLLHDLISAFRQDATQHRYADFDAVLDYCRRSANPVGRLLLHLSGDAQTENLLLSDAICTALQLINFYQDLLQDFDENDRVYLPTAEMEQYGVTTEHFRERRNDRALQQLLTRQYRRCRSLMLAGAPLGRRLRGRFGWEIRLIVEGGLRILARLEDQVPSAPFARPRLRRRDWPVMLWRSLFARYPEST